MLKVVRIACCIAAAMSPAPALAEGAATSSAGDAASRASEVIAAKIESDGADRIRLAGRLTMLTQRVAAASCALTSGVAVEESRASLKEANAEIEVILDALRYGNEDLHILGPEERGPTLRDLDTLDQEWQNTQIAVAAVLADGQSIDKAHVIEDHNLVLLGAARVLVSDILAQYANPYEVTQANALLISIAGQQRMLTQKMAKNACAIWTDYHAQQGREDLVSTMATFETSLMALRDGLPAAGVKAAPTRKIREDLDRVLARWAVIRGNLDALVAGHELSIEQKTEIFHDLNIELVELDNLIHDYKTFAERHHG